MTIAIAGAIEMPAPDAPAVAVVVIALALVAFAVKPAPPASAPSTAATTRSLTMARAKLAPRPKLEPLIVPGRALVLEALVEVAPRATSPPPAFTLAPLRSAPLVVRVTRSMATEPA